MSNELKTYTLQELYAHPMEPISWLAEGLLAPGLYFLGARPKWEKAGWRCSSAWRSAGENPFSGSYPEK